MCAWLVAWPAGPRSWANWPATAGCPPASPAARPRPGSRRRPAGIDNPYLRSTARLGHRKQACYCLHLSHQYCDKTSCDKALRAAFRVVFCSLCVSSKLFELIRVVVIVVVVILVGPITSTSECPLKSSVSRGAGRQPGSPPVCLRRAPQIKEQAYGENPGPCRPPSTCTRLVSNSAPTWSSRCCFIACHLKFGESIGNEPCALLGRCCLSVSHSDKRKHSGLIGANRLLWQSFRFPHAPPLASRLLDFLSVFDGNGHILCMLSPSSVENIL